jgi:amino acid transporter
MVGVVVGIGIFRTPSLVAANVGSEWAFIAVWLAGGAITLLGALCYAELAAAHPHAGGEYHFLSKAYGRPLAVLFGWARGSVIQTGAIGAVAFVFGDYAARLLPLGEHGPAILAALSIIALTAVNVAGALHGKTLQNLMTVVMLAALVAIMLAGLFAPLPEAAAAPAQPPGAPPGAIGLAMIFVLLTYGGWNEAAYLSAEVKPGPRTMVRVLLIGTSVVIALYVLVNLALLSTLGLAGLRASDAVATDMMQAAVGEHGALLVTLAVLCAALTTLNATIFTGARVYYAMAKDLSILPRVGRWSDRGHTPVNGLVLQAVVALALIGFGAASRDGFQAMVDYTAPVFWAFLLLVGASVFVLRARRPERPLPFRVPLYPVTPLLFCLSCIYMLYSSLAYTGAGALIGIGVVALGTPLLLLTSDRKAPARDMSSPRTPALQPVRSGHTPAASPRTEPPRAGDIR